MRIPKNKKIVLIFITIVILLITTITILVISSLNNKENGSNDSNIITVNNPIVNRDLVEQNIEIIKELGISLRNGDKLEDVYNLIGQHINSDTAIKYGFEKISDPYRFGDIIAAYRKTDVLVDTYIVDNDILLLVDISNEEIIQVILGNRVTEEIAFQTVEIKSKLGDPQFETVISENLYKEYAYPQYGILFTTVGYQSSNIERGKGINIIPPMSPEEFEEEYKLGGDERFHLPVYGI